MVRTGGLRIALFMGGWVGEGGIVYLFSALGLHSPFCAHPNYPVQSIATCH